VAVSQPISLTSWRRGRPDHLIEFALLGADFSRFTAECRSMIVVQTQGTQAAIVGDQGHTVPAAAQPSA
jgi:hypothetical protein